MGVPAIATRGGPHNPYWLLDERIAQLNPLTRIFQANEGHSAWSPGFSRSDAVSPWISKCFEPPSRDNTLPAKAGTPYTAPGPHLICYRTVRSLVPLEISGPSLAATLRLKIFVVRSVHSSGI
jgi:hypothetical protein